METRSSSRHHSGVNYRDLHEYGFPDDEKLTDKSTGAISKTSVKGRSDVQSESVSKKKAEIRKALLFEKSLTAGATEGQFSQKESEDEELNALRARMKEVDRQLQQKKVEAEKEKLRAELAEKEKELKGLKGEKSVNKTKKVKR